MSSTAEDMDDLEILEVKDKYFSGAMTSQDILDKIIPTFNNLGLTQENTLYAQSACPDEINHEKGDITDLFTNYMGKVFHLGGLGGQSVGQFIFLN